MARSTASNAKKTPAKANQKAKKGASGKKSILDMPLDSDDDGRPETEDVAVDWKDEKLNWDLINYINDCDTVKQGLFPSPGNDTRSGKGVPKSDHHYAIAVFLFANHPKYKTAFSRINTVAGKRIWATKIKNRLSMLVKACRQYTAQMGATGAGITSEDQIDMSLSNNFTTMWGLIREAFPWYFVLRDLISERPNITPVGLGNTSTGFDLNLLGPQEPDNDSDDDNSNNGDDDDDDNNNSCQAIDDGTVSEAGSHGEDVKPDVKPDFSGKASRKRTGAKPSTSAAAPKPPKKPKTSHEKFSEIAIKEEETTQKLLDIKKQKMANDSTVNVAQIQAKAQLKIRRAELQAQVIARREEHQFQLELARIQSRVGPSTASSASSSSSPFPYTFDDSSSDGPFPPFNF
ncbi:hypothetical protein BDN70DRAFT_872925 [Pholiota conissans]|uniref:Uncharacterized protein n=1 Tax=Pholiota conissans TaxID=109636 RepID=A0A9P6D569_9AGAR|nr:hypothetical protein BDN70DRAFT_872925 [Pholiota conissans]